MQHVHKNIGEIIQKLHYLTAIILPRVPRPKVPVLEAAATRAAGGVGGFVVGAGNGAGAGVEPDRRPRGVPLAPLFHRAP